MQCIVLMVTSSSFDVFSRSFECFHRFHLNVIFWAGVIDHRKPKATQDKLEVLHVEMLLFSRDLAAVLAPHN